jgi:alpha-galactosidase
MESKVIPARPAQNGVMASPQELNQMAGWAAAVFTGRSPDEAAPPVGVTVKRQDYSTLHFGRSCMDTALRIGERIFDHGLGTHSNSEIVLDLPEGAASFHAFAGIDNNYDTQGQRGSAVFSIEAEGAELFRSPVLRGGDAPFPVMVQLPEGVREVVLKVDATPDGCAYDQSDWANAHVVLEDGATIWVDEGHRQPFLDEAGPPFSFLYGGEPFDAAAWSHDAESREETDFTRYITSWTDPKSALKVVADVKVYRAYPAVDWVLHFENRGVEDTPIIESIQALDMSIMAGNAQLPLVVGHNVGDVFGEESFRNLDTKLRPGEHFNMAPQGGRPSNGAFPFFDLRYGADMVVGAIGWSGQWALEVVRDEAKGRIKAGMERTHLLLHPGEQIRSPRILLLRSHAQPVVAHNRFRRLMLFHYVPQQHGRPVALPFALQCFDRYSWTRPDWATEAGQIRAVETAAALGLDAHWLDAAWFVGGFPNGVGNWRPKPEAFPNGLGPVGKACHDHGLGFIVWYEPERVAPGTRLAQEHPEFVMGGDKGGLFKLNDPAARRWLTGLLSTQIAEYHIDIYRNDFNIDPLSFWRANDAEDRQGMTEIRYVEGHYAMWDELRARHPGLIIDNCASGGRRIDLETCMRSVPLWRSDTNCFPGNADWNPGHSAGISYYLPLHTACAWTPDAYTVRASTTAGLICQWDYMNEGFPFAAARQAIEEAKDLAKYWYGDIYPLTRDPHVPESWCAFQLHRPDLGEGIVLFFRRAASPYTGLEVSLQALNADATYVIERKTDDFAVASEERTGNELMTSFHATLPKQSSSAVVRYRMK